MALLVYADTDGVERSVTVGAEPVVVGRATECAIRSSDPRVSRNHARFYLDQTGQLVVEDLGSSNGVFIGQHKVMNSYVPMNEVVLVGSLTFRFVPAPPPMPPPLQQVEWNQPQTQPAAWAHPGVDVPYGQQPGYEQPVPSTPYAQPGSPYAAADAANYTPPHAAPPQMPPPAQAPPQMPPPAQAPPMRQAPPAPSDASGEPSGVIIAPHAYDPNAKAPAIVDTAALEVERKARQAAEEERDAYGARMAEVLGELRTAKEALAAAQGEVATSRSELETTRAELAKARMPVGDAEMQARFDEMLADQRKELEAQLRSAHEELEVARADLTASEERIVAEISAHEQRSSAELSSRVEELDVTRADLVKAEERIVELSRQVAELEQKIAESGRF